MSSSENRNSLYETREETLTDPVSGLPADGRRALDVGPGGRHVVVPAQLRQEVLDQIDEDQVPAGHHQVAQSHDGPLEQSQHSGRVTVQHLLRVHEKNRSSAGNKSCDEPF